MESLTKTTEEKKRRHGPGPGTHRHGNHTHTLPRDKFQTALRPQKRAGGTGREQTKGQEGEGQGMRVGQPRELWGAGHEAR